MTIEFDNLHTILRSLYSEMMPLCSDMAGVAKGIAGLGALFYVAVRVWQSLARAEAIDVYPLLRPFAVVDVCTICLVVLMMPCTRLPGSLTTHCACAVPANSRHALTSRIIFCFIILWI